MIVDFLLFAILEIMSNDHPLDMFVLYLYFANLRGHLYLLTIKMIKYFCFYI